MHVPKRKIVTIFAASGLLAAIVISFAFCSSQDKNIQPLSYNHKIHVGSVGMECKDCHLYVEDMAAATIPALEVCGTCHSEEPFSESPEELELIKYLSESTEIPWIEIYDVPDHVYFSHRRHVIGGELECSTCHGEVGEFTRPVTSAFLAPTMDNCMNCHKERQVTNDCLSCHR